MALFFKRLRIEAYFRNRRRRAWWASGAVIGIAILFGSGPAISWLGLPRDPTIYDPVTVLSSAGLVVTALAFLAWYISSKYIPSDKQIDQWAAIDWDAVNRRALQRFDLEGDELIQDPIVFRYYGFDDSVLRKPGRDNRWRTSLLLATVILSTRHQLMIYMCQINFLTGHFSREVNRESRYQDVVTIEVSSAERVVEMKSADKYDRQLARQYPKSVVRGKLHLNDVERVELRLVNDSVTLASYRGGGAARTDDTFEETASGQDPVTRLRKLIRDVRAQMADPIGRSGPDRL